MHEQVPRAAQGCVFGNAAASDDVAMRLLARAGDRRDRLLREIVITSQLALLGHEVAFKVHAIRLFEQKVTRSQLEQVILAGLGVTFVIPQAAQALDWIAQAHERFHAAV